MPSLLRPRTLLVDTNVWLAYFLGREPHAPIITSLFEACDARRITLAYTPTTLKDVFYLIPRQLRRDAIAAGEEPNSTSFAPVAWACVELMTEIAVTAAQSLAECDLAWMLRHTHPDLEDNLLMAAAETSQADLVITYDAELRKHYAPVCATPEEALALIRSLDP